MEQEGWKTRVTPLDRRAKVESEYPRTMVKPVGVRNLVEQKEVHGGARVMTEQGGVLKTM